MWWNPLLQGPWTQVLTSTFECTSESIITALSLAARRTFLEKKADGCYFIVLTKPLWKHSMTSFWGTKMCGVKNIIFPRCHFLVYTKQWLVEGIFYMLLVLETGIKVPQGMAGKVGTTKGKLLNVYGKPQVFGPQHSSPQKCTWTTYI